jgi:hypothetical protein
MKKVSHEITPNYTKRRFYFVSFRENLSAAGSFVAKNKKADVLHRPSFINQII